MEKNQKKETQADDNKGKVKAFLGTKTGKATAVVLTSAALGATGVVAPPGSIEAALSFLLSIF